MQLVPDVQGAFPPPCVHEAKDDEKVQRAMLRQGLSSLTFSSIGSHVHEISLSKFPAHSPKTSAREMWLPIPGEEIELIICTHPRLSWENLKTELPAIPLWDMRNNLR